jgi:hypothetical protein
MFVSGTKARWPGMRVGEQLIAQRLIARLKRQICA